MRFFYLLSFIMISIWSHGQLNCNNWLNLPSYQSYVNVGDFDIPGNKITIEAVFIRTAPYTGGYNWAGDLVSKHVDPIDVNYLLRPNNAEITTSNGYFTTPPICEIQLNKVYHVALVYDGATLKFYRNGFLMSSVAASGNMVQNDHQTRIGLYDGLVHNTNLIGYINEVRIWNVARTQAEIRANMNSSLPNPTTQTGLLAYYTFDILLNKQGNATWNGTLGGAASINKTPPNCNFFIDSCAVRNNISNIINDYTPVLSLNPCENKITVENASAFKAGDTVVMMQMKGAIIDSTNTANFGTVTDYKNAGNYEFNYVKSVTGNIVELKNILLRQYDIPIGKVQLIRVPYYQTANITATLTCLPWDGNKGGVLVLNVQDTVELNADINTTGRGFLKGTMRNSNFNGYTCGITDYYFPNNTRDAAGKGEGIGFLSPNRNSGKGPSANGGGGGMNTNSGGGGGSNGNKGGRGGYEWDGGCPNHLTSANWGLPGNILPYNVTDNKIFMGGGGGAGHCNNQYDDPTANADFNGGNGGGIIVIISNYIRNNNKKIISNGDNAYQLNVTNSYISHDGMGGGGAGGTVLLNANNYINNLLVEVLGGQGGDMVSMTPAGFIGPGGGGGGGVVWVKQNSLSPNIAVTNTGGKGGVIVQAGNIPYGATAGLNGINVFNLNIPITATLFKKNIDSVRVKDTALTCNSFDFKGFGFTNTNPIANWQWYFGDGGTANNQNPNYAYTATGIFPVKLVVTDINGCKDSITKNVNSSFLTMDAGPADTICFASSTTLQASNTGGTIFSWSPAIYLNDPALLNPIATPPTTTKFYLTATNPQGCTKTDSVLVTVRSANSFTINPPVNLCKNDSIQLSASGGDLYVWLPTGSLNNAAIANPKASPLTTTPYTVQITDTICNNTTTLSTAVTVIPLPLIKVSKANDIDCSTPQSQLTASGGTQYLWSPAATLNNANINNPIASPVINTKYVVKGTDGNGCINYDSLVVNVTAINKGGYLMPNAFTPNNDGINDCYGIKYWGVILDLDFSVYNRWGERIFHTNQPGDCWDGKIKGIPQDPAVFVYVIKARTTCENTVFRKGTFALIR